MPALGSPYPHGALGAELLARFLGLGAGPVGVRVQVQTLPSKGTRPLPLLEVLARLLPELGTTERVIAFSCSLTDALLTQPELWPSIPPLRAVK